MSVLRWEGIASVLKNPATPSTRRHPFRWWRPSSTSGGGSCCLSSVAILWATPSCGCSTASLATSSYASTEPTASPSTGSPWLTSSPTLCSSCPSRGCLTSAACGRSWWWVRPSTASGHGSRQERPNQTCMSWLSLGSLCLQWPLFLSWAFHPNLRPCGSGRRRSPPPAPLVFWEIRCVSVYLSGSRKLVVKANQTSV